MHMFSLSLDVLNQVLNYLTIIDLAKLSIQCKFLCALVQKWAKIKYKDDMFTLPFTYYIHPPINLHTSDWPQGLKPPRFKYSYLRRLDLRNTIYQIFDEPKNKISIKKDGPIEDDTLILSDYNDEHYRYICKTKDDLFNKETQARLAQVLDNYPSIQIRGNSRTPPHVYTNLILHMPKVDELVLLNQIKISTELKKVTCLTINGYCPSYVHKISHLFPNVDTLYLDLGTIHELCNTKFDEFINLKHVILEKLMDGFGFDYINESKKCWIGKEKIEYLTVEYHRYNSKLKGLYHYFGHIFDNIDDNVMDYDSCYESSSSSNEFLH